LLEIAVFWGVMDISEQLTTSSQEAIISIIINIRRVGIAQPDGPCSNAGKRKIFFLSAASRQVLVTNGYGGELLPLG
jgi:hypothetical protein